MPPYLGIEEANVTDIESFLVYPLIQDYYFYSKILLGLFVIFTLSLYFEEKYRKGDANFFSCAAVGSISVIVLAFMGSLFGMITADILTLTIVLGAVIIGIWFLTTE